MSLSVEQIFIQKYKEIQSRLPLKMNPPNDTGVSFQDTLDSIIKTNKTGNSSSTTSKQNVSPDIDSAITLAAQKYNIDPNLIRAIIKAESGFNPNAFSKAGAQGLMQLMPSTARGLGVTNSFDIQQNVDGGTRYIKGKLDQFNGDLKLALAAYNAGPGSVIKYNGIPPYPETQNYVRNVLKYYNDYQNK